MGLKGKGSKKALAWHDGTSMGNPVVHQLALALFYSCDSNTVRNLPGVVTGNWAHLQNSLDWRTCK
jgi:hypothetical protein